MANLIDGKQTASYIIAAITEKTSQLKQKYGITPGLAVILVGTDPASQVYVSAKSKAAKKCGFLSEQKTLPSDITEESLLQLIQELNDSPHIHGILLQLPLPKPLNSDKIIQKIAANRDVDGLNFLNIGKLTAANNTGFTPCTPAGVMLLLQRYAGTDLAGKHAVVIGRSNLVGKPLAQLLLQQNATVTIAHSKTQNLEQICKQADILIAAVGSPCLVKADWVKRGAIVIDIGVNRVNLNKDTSAIVGDVDFNDVAEQALLITPVPGGVGPMTIAMLMANTLNSALKANGLPILNLESIIKRYC